MQTFTDQLNTQIYIPTLPQRIISLVPSQTELLYHLGLKDEVVGITKFCIHPTQWHKNKTRIGGTKNINIEKAKALKPTLIIANKEENVKEQIEALQQIAPVWVSDIYDLPSALQMIKMVGDLTDKSKQSLVISQQIQQAFNQLSTFFLPTNNNQPSTNHQLPTTNYQPSTAYLIWQNPFMVAGGNTFINDMLQRCGFINVFACNERYPQITLHQLSSTNPQLIFLSSEPYPFKQKHMEELKRLIPNAQILLVDGEMFSWYGSRLLQAPTYFQKLIEICKQII